MLWLARRWGAGTIFFTWQNLLRRYPPPFGLVERYNLARFDRAVAGNADAVTVLRNKGFRRPVDIIPQLGRSRTVPARPWSHRLRARSAWLRGPAGGAEGAADLLRRLPGWRRTLAWCWWARDRWKPNCASGEEVGLGERLVWRAPVSSTRVPEVLAEFDVLVLPSRTRATGRSSSAACSSRRWPAECRW